MSKVTPLLRFLRALDADQKRDLAARCGTTYVYLYQLAGREWPNPELDFAAALVHASRIVGRKAKVKPLQYEDLLIGTGEGPRPPNKRQARRMGVTPDEPPTDGPD